MWGLGKMEIVALPVLDLKIHIPHLAALVTIQSLSSSTTETGKPVSCSETAVLYFDTVYCAPPLLFAFCRDYLGLGFSLILCLSKTTQTSRLQWLDSTITL